MRENENVKQYVENENVKHYVEIQSSETRTLIEAQKGKHIAKT
jgi:hypothetical protein